ncbi:MAG TPA: YncE family protein [Gemmatimonadales bacterium]|nr:YncE family protein [Gemmatimonadales bacterium]
MTLRVTLALCLGAATGLAAQAAPASRPPAPYKVGVVSESGDIVSWFVPDGGNLLPDRVVPVGIMPTDPDGPHNLAVSPDNRYYYVSIAHGTPYGSLWRLDATNDTVAGRAPLEMYPTTVGLTPDGEWAFVPNSDFFGDRPKVNPVSIVHVPDMVHITDLAACDMPHGSRSDHAATRVYLTCMHSDEVLELDVARLAITRRARVGPGMPMAGMAHGAHGAMGSAPPADSSCQPTYVDVSADDRTLYVACNHANTLLTLDAATLAVTHTVPVGAGAYNVGVSPDGRWVVVTNKKGRSVSLVDAATLTEVARIATSKPVVHGVAFSPDARYAYVSCESVGADPGAIDVIDLSTRQRVSSVSVPAQPTGIAVWRRPN